MVSSWDMDKSNIAHPGLRVPSESDAEWVSIGQPGDDVQYEEATGNDWENAGAVYDPPAYRLDALGVLWMRGVVKKTDDTAQFLGSPIFKLPAGRAIEGTGNSSFAAHAVGSLGVGTVGAVYVWGISSALEHLRGLVAYGGPDQNIMTALDLRGVSYLVTG